MRALWPLARASVLRENSLKINAKSGWTESKIQKQRTWRLPRRQNVHVLAVLMTKKNVTPKINEIKNKGEKG